MTGNSVPRRQAIPWYGLVMSLKEFQQAVLSGGFIDYDGYGHYADDLRMDGSYLVYPSNVMSGEQPPEWATRVIWFNR